MTIIVILFIVILLAMLLISASTSSKSKASGSDTPVMTQEDMRMHAASVIPGYRYFNRKDLNSIGTDARRCYGCRYVRRTANEATMTWHHYCSRYNVDVEQDYVCDGYSMYIPSDF